MAASTRLQGIHLKQQISVIHLLQESTLRHQSMRMVLLVLGLKNRTNYPAWLPIPAFFIGKGNFLLLVGEDTQIHFISIPLELRFIPKREFIYRLLLILALQEDWINFLGLKGQFRITAMCLYRLVLQRIHRHLWENLGPFLVEIL